MSSAGGSGASGSTQAPSYGSQEPQATHPLAVALQTFVDELHGLRGVMPLLSRTARAAEEEARDRKQEDLRRGPLLSYDEADYVELPDDHRLIAGKDPEFLRHEVIATGLHHAERDLGSATLLMMGAHFDRFVGDVVRAAFEIRPRAMEVVGSKVSLSEVNDLADVALIQDLMIEREIKELLGRPRREQVAWFESSCEMPPLDQCLGAELDEMTALHDLVSHHGGRLSRVALPGLRGLTSRFIGPHVNGGSVFVTKQYVDSVHDTLFLVALSICQGVWRSAQDDQGELADSNLHDLTYRLLILEEYELAQRALQLVEVFRGAMSEFFRLVSVINLAQTHRWLGDEVGCAEVLAREEWGAHEPPFQLSAVVLQGKWTEAERLMQTCVQESLLTRTAFEYWPVFREFRERPEYRRVLARAFPG